MERTNPLRLGVCFVLGAVTGTLLDGIHVYGDVLTYPHPAFGRWAFFVPLEFGLLGALAGLLASTLERIAGATAAFATPERVRELGLFACLYLATAFVRGDWRFVLAIALAALALARLARGSARGDWLYVLLATCLGPAGEALMSSLGVFEYRDPDVAGVPIWLPALWANGGFLIRRLIVPVAMPSSAGREQAGVVGDHARHPELAESLDATAVVNSPDV